MRKPIATAALAAFLTAAAQPALAQQAEYESLLFSLSWSPSYCASKTGQHDQEQCGAKRYAFVVHGLWPQYARGVQHSRKCLTATEVPAKVADGMLPVMPSHKLIEHEWEKHGACVDKDPAGYFAKAKAAYDRLKIPATFTAADRERSMSPDQIRRAFVDANPGLPANAVAVVCHTHRGRPGTEPPPPATTAPLTNVTFCLDKGLKWQACPSNVRDRCPDAVTLPPAK